MWRKPARLLAALAGSIVAVWPAFATGPETALPDLLDRLESAWNARDAAGVLALWSFPDAAARAEEAAVLSVSLGSSRVQLLLERGTAWPERGPFECLARSLEIDEPRARVDQWLLRFEGEGAGWRLAGRKLLGRLDGLLHLSLDPQGYRADGLRLKFPDLELQVEQGTLFRPPASLGPTALVFVGRARVRFAPGPQTEREQLRQYSGHEVLEREVQELFVRIHPGEWASLTGGAELRPAPAAAPRLARAQRLFDAHAAQSFVLDAGLPGAPWWVLPSPGDAVVAFRGPKGDLTYTLNAAQPEGINLYERQRRKQICLYPLPGKPTRYNEDDGRAADVLAHRLQVRFEPALRRLIGDDSLRLRLLEHDATLRLRLDDALTVESVSSPEAGRLLFFRVRGQHSLIVALGSLAGQDEITLRVRYSGTLDPRHVDEDSLQVRGSTTIEDAPFGTDDVRPQTALVYSNRTFWYPQVEADDFATAELDLQTPPEYAAVAGGRRVSHPNQPGRVEFVLDQPAKYLAVAVGELQSAASGQAGQVKVEVFATPRRRRDAAGVLAQARDAISFFEALFGPCPQQALNVVLHEDVTPGGHSPAGLVIQAERPLLTRGALRDDPATLWQIPGFFLAHELAHQWWGQGVTGQNHHERWLSEGLAQYSAALWARHARGEGAYSEAVERFARWARRMNEEGPIYLGQRLGHLKDDPQVYRAIVYNKGACMLHTLGKLVGEQQLMAGLRRYQQQHCPGKASTDDLRIALQEVTGRDLSAYFEAWIFGTELPELIVHSALDSTPGAFGVTLRIEAVALPGALPIEVVVHHAAGQMREIVEVPKAGGSFRIETPAKPLRVELRRQDGLVVVRGGH